MHLISFDREEAYHLFGLPSYFLAHLDLEKAFLHIICRSFSSRMTGNGGGKSLGFQYYRNMVMCQNVASPL